MKVLTEENVVREKVLEETCSELVSGGPQFEREIFVLNQALSLNMVCVLRHMRHFVNADRFDARLVAQAFLEHTVRESEHSDLIVARIRDLGGEPTFERDSVNGHGHRECESLSEFEEIIREDLAAERLAISVYAEMIVWLADADPRSSQLLQHILSLEEEHAEVMLKFIAVLN